MGSRRPEWKGERYQVNVKLSAEARRMLKALARKRKMPQSDVIEELIRAEHRRDSR